MSLKAKIEAVIYASEEPVTLAQLVGLLGHETQAELDRHDALQQTLALDVPGDDFAEDHPGEAPSEPTPLSGEMTAEATEAAPAPSPVAALAEDKAAEQVTPAPDLAEEARKAVREERARHHRLREHLRALLAELTADYATPERGLEVREVAGGYRLATKPEYHDAVRGFVRLLKPPLKLTLQALETLAVVAYKQPVTAPEISEIRGVDSGGVLGSLLARKLVTTAGRKQVIGRPILYKTTRDFLLRFGLKDVSELPSIEEFEKMAGELADGELSEDLTMTDTPPRDTAEAKLEASLEQERASIAPQADGDGTPVESVLDSAGPIDGRLSAMPPAYDSPEDDPGGREAGAHAEIGVRTEGR